MPEEFAKGLEGVLAAESKVCFIDGEEGKLLYQGYNIHDLAEKSCFEEVAYLLLFGRLPAADELKKFNRKLAAKRELPKDLLKAMKIYAKTASPMDALRTSVSMLADNDKKLKDSSPARNLERSINLTAKMPMLVTAAYRIKKRKPVVRPKANMSQAWNFLYMLTGKKPSEVAVKALDTDFILHAEHGFNASTFSARVTISTLSDLYAAITAAIGTLKGPLHGGAAGEVFQMLKAIKTADRAEAYVKNALMNKQKIMGLGHRVYKTRDPRALHLRNMAKMMADETRNYKYFSICDRVEEVAVPLLSEKHIYPNVDFYSSTVYNALGIPEDLFDTLFATSRITGWCAHVLEQLADNRIIRPREKYIGAMDLPYVPIGERGKKEAVIVQTASPVNSNREEVVHVSRRKKADASEAKIEPVETEPQVAVAAEMQEAVAVETQAEATEEPLSVTTASALIQELGNETAIQEVVELVQETQAAETQEAAQESSPETQEAAIAVPETLIEETQAVLTETIQEIQTASAEEPQVVQAEPVQETQTVAVQEVQPEPVVAPADIQVASSEAVAVSEEAQAVPVVEEIQKEPVAAQEEIQVVSHEIVTAPEAIHTEPIIAQEEAKTEPVALQEMQAEPVAAQEELKIESVAVQEVHTELVAVQEETKTELVSAQTVPQEESVADVLLKSAQEASFVSQLEMTAKDAAAEASSKSEELLSTEVKAIEGAEFAVPQTEILAAPAPLQEESQVVQAVAAEDVTSSEKKSDQQ